MTPLLLLTACALNLAEMRSARVLGGGEVQLTQGNTAVLPTAAVRESIDAARLVIDAAQSGEPLTDEEAHTLIAGATAVALSAPGYGTYGDLALGFGYGWEGSVRMGSGVMGVGLRRRLYAGYPLYAAAGIRAQRSGGAAWIGALDTANDFVSIADLHRTDLSATLEGGLELAEVLRLWGGLRGGLSPYRLSLDASALGLGSAETHGRVSMIGGFFGFGLGWRYVHVAAELGVERAYGEAILLEQPVDLGGWVVHPSWGLQFTF